MNEWDIPDHFYRVVSEKTGELILSHPTLLGAMNGRRVYADENRRPLMDYKVIVPANPQDGVKFLGGNR